MVPLYCATEATLGDTLERAFEAGTPGFREPPRGTLRAIFLSGMYTGEAMDVVNEYLDHETLPRAVFAAAVPNSWGKSVAQLLTEIYDDDAASVRSRMPGVGLGRTIARAFRQPAPLASASF